MSITSVTFLLFVAVSLMIYWQLPSKYQWWVLLADSLIFYFLNAEAYTFIYLLTSVVSVYFATIFFEKEENIKRKRIVLTGTLIINMGILAILKYTNLLLKTINYLGGGRTNLGLVSWYSSLAVSFYTLQIVAYLLDIYWGVTYRETNILKLLLFTSYFPLMISGPISMHEQLGRQLFEEHRFDYDRVTTGVRRIAWGLAKKVVVADRMTIPVSYMFRNTETFSGLWIFVAGLSFMIELYFDFSGCMDIIIGVSQCFGIILDENFKAPFLSKSVQEFWQRWHITLGRWLKNYVMYPLLKTERFIALATRCKKLYGKAGRKIPSYIAMLAVWFLIGLWHGDSWKYILGQGLWFWLIIVFGQVMEPLFKRWKKALRIDDQHLCWNAFQVCRTMLLCSIGMIFFNATDLWAAFHMIGQIFAPTHLIEPLRSLLSGVWALFGGKLSLAGVTIIVMMQVIADFRVYGGKDVQVLIKCRPWFVRWAGYFAFVFFILLTGSFGKSSFIYFGF